MGVEALRLRTSISLTLCSSEKLLSGQASVVSEILGVNTVFWHCAKHLSAADDSEVICNKKCHSIKTNVTIRAKA